MTYVRAMRDMTALDAVARAFCTFVLLMLSKWNRHDAQSTTLLRVIESVYCSTLYCDLCVTLSRSYTEFPLGHLLMPE